MLNWLTKLVDRSTYSQGRTALPRDRRSRASPEQISAWRAFARAFLAVTRLTEVSLRGTQLDPSDYDVLVTLAQAPAEGVRPSELAERVLLTKSGITRLVDRLVERGLIERHVCPSDRRGQLVALTPRGRHLLRRAAPGLLRALGKALGSLSDTELTALKRSSERILGAAATRT